MSKSTTKPQFKRRNYYIEKEFQTKFILKFCLLMAFGSVLTIGLVYWLAQHSTTVAIQHGRIGVHSTSEYLLPLMAQTVFIQLIITSLAAIGMMVFVSHKIAGPLFRLKAMLTKLGDGDFSATMSLRQGDQLQKVAQAYNEAVSKLNLKMKNLKRENTVDSIKKELDHFKTL